MADQTQRLEIATVRAEIGSNIVYRFANDAVDAGGIPTDSGNIPNLKQVIAEIQEDGAEKISIATTIYQSPAAGLAATADGGIYLVQSADADTIYTVWKNDGGSAVNTGKTAMSSQAIQDALTASNEAAQAAEDAADVATTRTAGFLQPAAEAPTIRDDGLPLQIGDRYFNTEEQAEYIFRADGWSANESQAAIEGLKADLASGDVGKGADLVNFNGLEAPEDLDVGDMILGIRAGFVKRYTPKTIVDYVQGLLKKDAISLSAYAAGIGGDDTDGIQAAVNAAIAASLPLYVGPAPSGAWNMPNNSPTDFVFAGSLTIFGAGMDKSIIRYNDDLSNSRRDFFKGSAVNFICFDMAFESSWGNDGNYDQRSQLVAITGTGTAYVQRARFSKSRYMSLILSGFSQAHVSDCEFDHGVADGCRLTNAGRAEVVNNKFYAINDDMIALHTTDTLTAPVDRSAIISGNMGWDSQGIAVLGAKMLKLTDNILIRPHTRGLLLGCSDATDGSSVEGNTPPICLDISGNLVVDPFLGTTFSASSGAGLGAIVLRNTAPRKGGAPGFVGGSNGSGGVVQPYEYVYLNNVDDLSAANPGAWWNRFTNNSVIRTLKPAAKYSDYGFGPRYGRSGPVDPAITAASFLGTHYLIMGQAQDLLLDGNNSNGAVLPVAFQGASGAGYVAWRNAEIQGGQLINYTGGGAVFVGGDGLVSIDGVTVDGDPFNVHPFRLANGKWNSSYTTYSAFWFSAARGVVKNCRVRNVGAVFQGATPDRVFWEGNVLACNPVSTGYNANNIGIGDISVPARLGATVIVEDGDPASATFNTILNVCLKAATAMPSTGKYVAGHVVMAATTDDTLCWKRKTTGSAHVLGTDWAAK